MLKTVSSIVNAIGALNYKGTWNASTNTPTLTSGAGTKGDYYQVSVAGSTALDGISNWGVGDVAAFNGATWQRIEGGADLNGVNLSVSGTSTLSGLTASTALALDASKNVVSVTNTGSGSNVLATSPTIATPSITGDTGVSVDATGLQRFRNIEIGTLTTLSSTTITLFPVYARGRGEVDITVSGYDTALGSFFIQAKLSFGYSNVTIVTYGMGDVIGRAAQAANNYITSMLSATIAASDNSNNIRLTITSVSSGTLNGVKVTCHDHIGTN